MKTDPIAAPVAGELLGRLIDAFADPGNDVLAVCEAGLISGSMLVADHCCDGRTAAGEPCMGQLTVRVEDVFPTDAFPAPRADAIPVCGTSWAVRLELAVLRCALAMDAAGHPPPMDAEQAVALEILADAALVRETVLALAAETDRAVTVGGWLPMGPDGGCVGGAMTVTFLIE